jgi:hypothetical protein
MGPFPKSRNYEYILVAVDYVSKWVEAIPCRAADAKNSKKMFEEIIFPRFGVLRMVIIDGGTHFTDKKFHAYLMKHGICHNVATPYTLKQVAKQRHPISKSRIFCRRWSMKWVLHGKIDYPMHYGYAEWPIRHHWACHHTNWSMGRPAIYLWN